MFREDTSGVLVWSADTRSNLNDKLREIMAIMARAHPNTPIRDLIYHFNRQCSHEAYRGAVVFETRQELLDKLANLKYLSVKVLPEFEPVKPIFLFTGEGGLFRGVVAELYYSYPEFRRNLDLCDREFAKKLKLQNFLEPLLTTNTENVGRAAELWQTEDQLPWLFSFQFALMKLWRSWGVDPDFVASHSDGAYAAAVGSNILDFDSAIELIVKRWHLISKHKKRIKGKMVAIEATMEEVEGLVDEFNKESDSAQIYIACHNAPEQIVVCGKEESIKQFVLKLVREGIRTIELSLSIPFHAPLLQDIASEYEEITTKNKCDGSVVPFISPLDGKLFEQALPSDYWRLLMTKPIYFNLVANEIKKIDNCLLIEIGPRNTLTKFIHQFLGNNFPCHPSLARPKPVQGQQQSTRSVIANIMAQLHLKGHNCNWRSFHTAFMPKRIPRPIIVVPTPVDVQKLAEKHEPIAVIANSCLFPGGETPEEVWELLNSGRDAITNIPQDRIEMDLVDRTEPRHRPPLRGGFLRRNPLLFDADFFGLHDEEAAMMDPQRRLSMEIVWEALERAGIPPSALKTSRVAIFGAFSMYDHANLLAGTDLTGQMIPTGVAPSAAAGWVSQFLGTVGPTSNVDGACASSFAAIQAGIDRLQRNECDLAIAFAGNLALRTEVMIQLTRAGMLAPDGLSKVFDESANGYARGEGFGCVILMRNVDAIKQIQPVLGIIRSILMRSAGARDGLTVPKSVVQAGVMRDAIKAAGLKPRDINYAEAHGTGTSLGDPTETEAMWAVFAEGREKPLQIRSCKGAMGHPEAPAGMQSLTAVLQAMKHGSIPGQINFSRLNPKIKLGKYAEIQTQSKEWKGRRVAIVNAFGFTGETGTMVVEEPPRQEITVENEKIPKIVILSAKNKAALTELCKAYEDHLKKNKAIPLEDIFHTTTGRDHFPYRMAFIAGSTAELENQLAEEKCVSGVSERAPYIVFSFTGQGSQYINMGKELYGANPVFRESLNNCFSLFSKCGVELEKVFFGAESDESEINKTIYAQTSIFCLQIALVDLWKSWNIQPDLVVGHSIGEYAGAVVAGIFSLKDAVKLLAKRAQLMQDLPDKEGGMWAIFGDIRLASEALKKYLQSHENAVIEIAADNSRKQLVVSGKIADIKKFVSQLDSGAFRYTQLSVSHAFHSSLMQEMLEKFREAADQVEYNSPRVRFISTLTGKEFSYNDRSPDYWVGHISSRVRFREAVEQIKIAEITAAGRDVCFVELGPRPVLTNFVKDCVGNNAKVFQSFVLQRSKNNLQTMLTSLGQLYVRGAVVDWQEFNNQYQIKMRKVILPTYRFQRKLYSVPEVYAGQKLPKNAHPLLGKLVTTLKLGDQDIYVFNSFISRRWPHTVEAHALYDEPVIPGAAFVSAAISALAKLNLAGDQFLPFIENIEFHYPIKLPDYRKLQLQTIIKHDKESENISISFCGTYSDPENKTKTISITYVTCRAKYLPRGDNIENKIDIQALTTGEVIRIPGEELYKIPTKINLHLGEPFQRIKEVFVGKDYLLARILPPKTGRSARRYDNTITPEDFDSYLHMLFSNNVVAGKMPSGLEIPVFIESFYCNTDQGVPTWVLTRRENLNKSTELETKRPEIELFLKDGAKIGEIRGLVLRPVSQEKLFGDLQHRNISANWFYKVVWEKQKLPTNTEIASNSGAWMIFADDSSLAKLFVAKFKQQFSAIELVVVVPPCQPKLDNVICEVIEFAKQDEYGRLFTAYLGKNIQAIIDLRSSMATTRSLDPDVFIEGNYTALQRVCFLIQSLIQCKFDQEPKYCLVTQGLGYQLGETKETVNMNNATFAGFMRTIALEHPELEAVHVDFSKTTSVEQRATAVLNELQAGSLGEVWYKNSENGLRRMIPKLQKQNVNPNDKTELKFSSEASYLVTGGLGGIGLKLIGCLIEKGAKHIFLANRRDVTGAEQRKLDKLAGVRARIYPRIADVSDPKAVEGLFKEIEEKFPPLKGVFHAAGVLSDALLINQNWGNFEKVFAPKVKGSWYLHSRAQKLNIKLDYFVLFSSLVSVFGLSGQSNYAAANSFLDALVTYRRQLGLPAASHNWSAWGEVGMAVRNLDTRLAQNLGLRPLAPMEALYALELALLLDMERVMIVDVDWDRFVRRWSGKAGFLQHIVQQRNSEKSSSALLRKLQAAAPEKRHEILADRILEIFKGARRDLVNFNKDTHFKVYGGFSSLVLQGISEDLTRELGDRLVITLPEIMFTPTINALVTAVLQKLHFYKKESVEENVKTAQENRLALPNQERMWYQFAVQEKSYLPPVVVKSEILLFSIDMEKLNRAWKIIVEYYDVLRVSFRAGSDGRVSINPVTNLELTIDSVSGKKKENSKPFDWAKPPLVRISVSKQSTIVMTALRIIMTDDVAEIIFKHLLNTYSQLTGLKTTDNSRMPKIPSCLKVVADYHNWKLSEQYKQDGDFWRRQFLQLDCITPLPVTKRRSSTNDSSSKSHNMNVDSKILRKLKGLSEENEIPLKSILMIVGGLALCKLVGKRRLVIGVHNVLNDGYDLPVRSNLLPLVISVNDEGNLLEQVKKLVKAYQEALRHSGIDFADILTELNVPIDFSYHPLTQFAVEIVTSSKDETDHRSYSADCFPYDILLRIVLSDERLNLVTIYNSRIIKTSDINKYRKFYVTLLSNIANKPTQKIKMPPNEDYRVINRHPVAVGEIEGMEALLKKEGWIAQVHSLFPEGSADEYVICIVPKNADRVTIGDFITILQEFFGLMQGGESGVKIGGAAKKMLDVFSGNLDVTKPEKNKEKITQLAQKIRNSSKTVLGRKIRNIFVSLTMWIIEAQLSKSLDSKAIKEFVSVLKGLVISQLNEAEGSIDLFDNILALGKNAKEYRDEVVITKAFKIMMRARIPNYMWPRLFIVHSLPRTTGEKVDDYELRRIIKEKEDKEERVGDESYAQDMYHLNPFSHEEKDKRHEASTSSAFENVINSDLGGILLIENKLIEIYKFITGKSVAKKANIFFNSSNYSILLRLHNAIKNEFHVTLTLASIYNLKTIEKLAQAIQDKSPVLRGDNDPDIDPILRIKEVEGRKVKVFFIHPFTGMAQPFREIAPYINFTAYGIRNPKLGKQKNGFGSLEEMAEEYARIIREICQGEPAVIVGWSLGGTIGYEVAHRLTEMGVAVKSVIFADTAHFNIRNSGKSTLLDFSKIMRAATRNKNPFMQRVFLQHIHLSFMHMPRPSYKFRVVLLKTGNPGPPFDFMADSPDNGWSGIIPHIEIYSYPENVNHYELFSGETVKITADLINRVVNSKPKSIMFNKSLNTYTRILLHTARYNDSKIVRTLINKSNKKEIEIDLKATDRSGKTALHWFAFYGNNEIVIELLKAGLDPTIRDLESCTPADLAEGEGHAVLAAVLRNYSTHKNLSRLESELLQKMNFEVEDTRKKKSEEEAEGEDEEDGEIQHRTVGNLGFFSGANLGGQEPAVYSDEPPPLTETPGG